MATKILKSIKGRRMRITRTNSAGVPVIGSCSVVTTAGFVQVVLSTEEEAGEEHTVKNAWGELCINDKEGDTIKWVNVTMNLCEVHPDVLDIVGGANPVIVSANTIGATFGPTPNPDGFAVEVWTKAFGLSASEWGYFVVPFVKNGKLNGDVTIENGPLTFSLAGEGFPAPADWGVGPHGDNPLLATGGFPTGDLFGAVVTTVAPPTLTTGCAALADT